MEKRCFLCNTTKSVKYRSECCKEHIKAPEDKFPQEWSGYVYFCSTCVTPFMGLQETTIFKPSLDPTR